MAGSRAVEGVAALEPLPALCASRPGFGSGASSGIDVRREAGLCGRLGVGEDSRDRVCRSLGRMDIDVYVQAS